MAEGTHFEVPDPLYLPVVVDSSEEIRLTLSSFPNRIVLNIDEGEAASLTRITVSGLEPLKTYYLYTDNYHNLTEFTSDERGSYTFEQDISRPHRIFIQSDRSTIFLTETGWSNPSVGTWDPVTRTATLTTDVSEVIQVDVDNVVIDGKGHTLTGRDSGEGIYVERRRGVTVKNLVVRRFLVGVSTYYAQDVLFSDLTVSECFAGIYLDHSSASVVRNNICTGNDYAMVLNFADDNVVSDNFFVDNDGDGIHINQSDRNTVIGNMVSNNYYGLCIYNADENTASGNVISASRKYNLDMANAHGNTLYRNDFLQGDSQIGEITGTNNHLSLPKPIGGNHWSNWVSPDEDGDGFVDKPFVFGDAQDALPLVEYDADWNSDVGEFWYSDNTRSTFLDLEEQSSTSVEFDLILKEQLVDSGSLIVSGDRDGVLEGFHFTLVTVVNGAFDGYGIAMGEATVYLDGHPYTVSWKGMADEDRDENVIHLRGALFGDLEGGLSAEIIQSVPGSGVYDRYRGAWVVSRVLGTTGDLHLEAAGDVTFGGSHTFTSSADFTQSRMQGLAYGYYSGPIQIMLNQCILTGPHAYQEKGFSLLSYQTADAEGMIYSHLDRSAAEKISLSGLATQSLSGKFTARFDGALVPKTLLGNIERIGLDKEPTSSLRVNVISFPFVSPGDTVDYVIEYRNDGPVVAPDVAIFMRLSPFTEFISCSDDGLYESTHEVSWFLGDIPPRSVGYLTVRVTVMWGLPQEMVLDSRAYIASFSWHSDEIGTIRNGVNLPSHEYRVKVMSATGFTTVVKLSAEDLAQFECPNFHVCAPLQVAGYRMWRSTASKYDAKWVPILNTGDFLPIADALHAALASPVFGDGDGNPVATEYNGLGYEYLSQDYAIEYSGGGPSGDGALATGKETIVESEGVAFTKYRVSPVLFDPDVLLPLYKEAGVKKVVLYQSEYDDLLSYDANIYYEHNNGWVMTFNGKLIPPVADDMIAKLTGVSKIVQLFSAETSRQIEWLKVEATKGESGRYGKDKISIKLSDSTSVISFYLQGNSQTGDLFKQSDFANIEDIEVELRDRSRFMVDHSGWQAWILNCEDILTGVVDWFAAENFFSSRSHGLSLAKDPNEILVDPEGGVFAGSLLTYTINFENEGEGNAYGVYITDRLTECLDATTLQIEGGGVYDAATGTITWSIGFVPPKGQGSVSFSVKIRNDVTPGEQVINFATVYFPSVPEVTRTNPVINPLIAAQTLDTTPPVSTVSISPMPGEYGWGIRSVKVRISAHDNEGGSGVKQIEYRLSGAVSGEFVHQGDSAEFAVSAEGETTVAFHAVDRQENVEEEQTVYVRIDTTPPSITMLAPQEGAEYLLNSEVPVSWAVTDTLSGIASSQGTLPSGGVLDTSVPGEKAFNVTAEDKAGNEQSVGCSYSVRYICGDLLPPVNTDGSSVFKLGRVVPLKFQLKDAQGVVVIDAVARLYLTKLSDDVFGQAIEAASAGEANSGNIFRYSSMDELYIFNLGTDNLSVGTWELKIELDDGATHRGTISLK